MLAWHAISLLRVWRPSIRLLVTSMDCDQWYSATKCVNRQTTSWLAACWCDVFECENEAALMTAASRRTNDVQRHTDTMRSHHHQQQQQQDHSTDYEPITGIGSSTPVLQPRQTASINRRSANVNRATTRLDDE